MSSTSFLEKLNLPDDLRRLNPKQQELICRELRQRLIRTVSHTGGHLASNLGVVELTVALHTVFQSPKDQIVWDVGHQAYAHKMLTGRLKDFETLRQENGISGFPRPSESVHDAFIAGHASTSISAACGLAKAKSLAGDPHTVVAVVGDGAFTGGMIYEALNNAGRGNDRLVVVLNDNHMSISQSVGAVARYLAEKRTSEQYLHLKGTVENTLQKIPVVGKGMRDAIYQSKAVLRRTIYHSNLFEDFGFDYLGPIDGHDLPLLIQVLRRAKALCKPVIVHVNTVKGKGYTFAEKNPAKYHGVGKFDLASGELGVPKKTFSSVFGEHLVQLAQRDKRICAITAAMLDGTGLQKFAEVFQQQDRFFDVGIAEGHAVTFAGGLAANGLLPVFAVYSTFLQRGFDQLIHDAAIDQRHIVLAVDRAGIVGGDGETHQGLFDTAFLSQIPGVTIYSPATYAELIYAMDRSFYHTKGIAVFRYPKGEELKMAVLPDDQPGDWRHIKRGGRALVITYGREFAQVYQASETLGTQGKQADILKLHRIIPIPEECIAIARKYPRILFVEEGVAAGGIGEHFSAALTKAGYRGILQIAAVQEPFIPNMPVAEGLKYCGLDARSLADRMKEILF